MKNKFIKSMVSIILSIGVALTASPSYAEDFLDVGVRRNLEVVNTIQTGNNYQRGKVFIKQAAPTALTGASTLTAAQMLSGLFTLTQSTGATVALTTPTGAQIQKALPVTFAVDDSFDFRIINLSAAAADTGTLTAGASGVSIVGSVIIPSAHSTTIADSTKTYRCRKTAANTFVIYALN